MIRSSCGGEVRIRAALERGGWVRGAGVDRVRPKQTTGVARRKLHRRSSPSPRRSRWSTAGVRPDERERGNRSAERERGRGEREGRSPHPEAVNLAAPLKPSISSFGFRIASSWAEMRPSGVLAAKKREDFEGVELREDVEDDGGSLFDEDLQR
ncbi:hypothetical protein L484_005986 [Morus notabilis]|uniref:Uncharacterized protein n=1 Tax=Morus notabilis TaxID=981085 RepID=W9R413_9ROSA|nr:hypothetical protein L484_005986 [Morus notabilis]